MADGDKPDKPNIEESVNRLIDELKNFLHLQDDKLLYKAFVSLLSHWPESRASETPVLMVQLTGEARADVDQLKKDLKLQTDADFFRIAATLLVAYRDAVVDKDLKVCLVEGDTSFVDQKGVPIFFPGEKILAEIRVEDSKVRIKYDEK